MTIMVDIGEAETRLSELLAKVEAGDEVILARGSAPVVRMTKVMRDADVERAIAQILEARAGIPPTTAEEILAWRDEGRR